MSVTASPFTASPQDRYTVVLFRFRSKTRRGCTISVFPDPVLLLVGFDRLEKAFNACCDLSKGLTWFVNFSVLAVVSYTIHNKNKSSIGIRLNVALVVLV